MKHINCFIPKISAEKLNHKGHEEKSGEWGVGSEEFGVGSSEWGVGSAEWGVGSGEWGVKSEK